MYTYYESSHTYERRKKVVSKRRNQSEGGWRANMYEKSKYLFYMLPKRLMKLNVFSNNVVLHPSNKPWCTDNLRKLLSRLKEPSLPVYLFVVLDKDIQTAAVAVSKDRSVGRVKETAISFKQWCIAANCVFYRSYDLKKLVSVIFSGIHFQLAWILLILLYHQHHSWKVWCHLWIWPFSDQMDPYC